MIKYYVSVIDDEIVGMVQTIAEMDLRVGGLIYWINCVYVKEENRKQGIYKSIHNYIIDEAQKDPACLCVRLFTNPRNKVAIKTYQNLGMVPVDYDGFLEFSI